MWVVDGANLQMTEGDYGVQLPMAIKGTELSAADSFMITIKTGRNTEALIEKEYSDIQDSTINFELTEAESELLEAGMTYVYSLDWYQEGLFMCNLIPSAFLKVVDKA